MAAKRGVIVFTVKGKRAFPVDMLRYDNCYPSRGIDAQAIVQSAFTDDTQEVELKSFRDTGFSRQPTAERWKSFGWTVMDVLGA